MVEPCIIGVYGHSNTGKTTLIEQLLKILTYEGYKIATIKRTDKQISLDSKGKDTWRHQNAGAHIVVFSSACETDFLVNTPFTTADIIRIISAIDCVDLIFIEGADDPAVPKIRIGTVPQRENTIGIYENNIQEIVIFIKKEISTQPIGQPLQITVNGKPIPLTKFPEEIITNTIYGMLTSLKDVDIINEATIHLSYKRKKIKKTEKS